MVGLKGNKHKLFEKDLAYINVRKFSFSNRVVDHQNCISAPRVNSGTINTFKKRVSVELEPETVN